MAEQSKVGFFPETVGMEDPKGVEWPYTTPASPSASPLLLFSNLQWFRLIMSSTALPIITLAQQQILSISSLNLSKMQLSFTISNIITLSWALTFRDNVHRKIQREAKRNGLCFMRWTVNRGKNLSFEKGNYMKLYFIISTERETTINWKQLCTHIYVHSVCVCLCKIYVETRNQTWQWFYSNYSPRFWKKGLSFTWNLPIRLS